MERINMGNFISSCSGSGYYEDTANSLIFHPPKESPINYNRLESYQKLQFCGQGERKTALIVIHPIMYTIPDFYTEMNPKKWILWSHGNACSALQMVGFLNAVAQRYECGVVVYDYQGYGLSTGKPSEQNCYQDVTNVVEYMINEMKIQKQNIIMIGQSLGTGVTVDYATKSGWTNPIVLISPYKSMLEVASELSGHLSSSTRLLTSTSLDRFDTYEKVDKLKCPVKIFHGEKDDLIPVRHGVAIWEKLPNKTLHPTWIPHADHNNMLENINWDFLKNLV